MPTPGRFRPVRSLAIRTSRRGGPATRSPSYTKMLRASPGDPRVLFGLGVALRSAGDFDRSRQALEEILKKHKPPDGSVNLELARTLELQGDVDGAVRNYETAAASPPQNRDATIELARLLKKMGRMDEALERLTRLRAAYPDDRAIDAELNALRSGR